MKKTCPKCGRIYYIDIEIASMIDFKLCETCQNKIKEPMKKEKKEKKEADLSFTTAEFQLRMMSTPF